MNQNYYKIVDEDVTEIAKSDLPWEQLKNKTVLITGANGYLASYMVFTMLKRNDLFDDNIHIVALCRNEEKAKDRFAPMLERTDLEFLIQDVCEPIRYDKKVDVVIHAASLANPFDFEYNPSVVLWTNIVGTKNILELCRLSKTSTCLFFSSSAIYGNQKDASNEDTYGLIDLSNTRFAYSEGKRALELMAFSYYKEHGIPCKIVRPFIIFGPGVPLEHKKFYTDFLQNVLNKEDIIIKSDGSAKRSILYISDAISAFFTVLFKGNCEAYNIAGNDCVTIREFADTMAKLNNQSATIKKQEDEYLKTPIQNLIADSSKLMQLGWKQHTTLEDGIMRYIASYQ